MAHIPAERCLAIIELLAEGAHEMPLGEIAERLALPKSGAHRLLTTLVEVGWAEQNPHTGFYRLTMRLTILGQQLFLATGIPDITQPLLDRLAVRCKEFVRLAVVDSHTLVWVAHAQGAAGGLMYQPSLNSNTVPLFATASGKAWLATLPPREAMDVLAKNGGLQHADRYGANAVRTLDELQAEIDKTAQRGYGLAVGEAESGVTAVAAAIRVDDDSPTLGTVSIAGPSARLTERRIVEWAPLVQQTARDLARLWPLRGGMSPARSREGTNDRPPSAVAA